MSSAKPGTRPEQTPTVQDRSLRFGVLTFQALPYLELRERLVADVLPAFGS